MLKKCMKSKISKFCLIYSLQVGSLYLLVEGQKLTFILKSCEGDLHLYFQCNKISVRALQSQFLARKKRKNVQRHYHQRS